MEVYTTLFFILSSHVISCFSHSLPNFRESKTSEEKFQRIPPICCQQQFDRFEKEENTADIGRGYISPVSESFEKQVIGKKNLYSRVQKDDVSESSKTKFFNRGKFENSFQRISEAYKKIDHGNYEDRKHNVPLLKFFKRDQVQKDSLEQENEVPDYSIDITTKHSKRGNLPYSARQDKAKNRNYIYLNAGQRKRFVTAADENPPCKTQRTKTNCTETESRWLFDTKPTTVNYVPKVVSNALYDSTFQSETSKTLKQEVSAIIKDDNPIESNYVKMPIFGNITLHSKRNGLTGNKDYIFNTAKETSLPINFTNNYFQSDDIAVYIDRGRKRAASHYEFYPLGQKGWRNMTKPVPPCQKSRFYNLTALLNLKPVRPYNTLAAPQIQLCCPNVSDVKFKINETETNELDNLENKVTCETTNSCAVSLTSESSTCQGETLGTTNCLPQSKTNAFLNKTPGFSNASGAASLPSTLMDEISPLFEMHLIFKDISSTKKYTKEMSKLQLIENKAEGLVEDGFEQPYGEIVGQPKGFFIRKQKMKLKNNPWGKFCPCEKTTKINNASTCSKQETSTIPARPWVSTCCISTLPPAKGVKGENFSAKTISNLENYQTGKSRLRRSGCLETFRDSVMPQESSSPENVLQTVPFQIINISNEQTEKPFSKVLSSNHSKNNVSKLVVIYGSFPFSSEQPFVSNIIPSRNDTSCIKIRSIFNQILPSAAKKNTATPKNNTTKSIDQQGKSQSNLTTSSLDKKESSVNSETVDSNTSIINLQGSKTEHALKHSRLSFRDLFDEDTTNCNIYGNDLSKFESEGKGCETYLLKFLKPDTIEENVNHNIVGKYTTVKSLKLIEKYDGSPKYFIEVPDTLGNMIKKVIEVSNHDPAISSEQDLTEKASKETESSKRSKYLIKPMAHRKPIVLYLQPFEVNEHKVYLPLNTYIINKPKRKKTSVKSSYAANYLFERKPLDEKHQKPHISSVGVVSNKTSLPFALIPAYLTFHPDNNKSPYDINVRRDLIRNNENSYSNIGSLSNENESYNPGTNNIQDPLIAFLPSNQQIYGSIQPEGIFSTSDIISKPKSHSKYVILMEEPGGGVGKLTFDNKQVEVNEIVTKKSSSYNSKKLEENDTVDQLLDMLYEHR